MTFISLHVSLIFVKKRGRNLYLCKSEVFIFVNMLTFAAISKKHINHNNLDMKNILKLFSLLFVLIFSTNSMAQQVPELPLDPEVRYGKLANGLTYYIRHNAEQKGLADFYIAQKVGAVQEEDSQRGLAHFLEHMCFNGSEHFPGSDDLVKYCESIGVKFGYNLNAYTA